MRNPELTVGIVVTAVLGLLLVYAIVRVWSYEAARPTETIVPE